MTFSNSKHVSEQEAPAAMDPEYWNRGIKDYDQEVLDSITADRSGVIRRRLEQYARKEKLAADFGCGVGNYVSVLARNFKRVYAIDFASRLLKIAQQRCEEPNVRWMKGDLATTRFRMRRAHFGVCQNVLISPERHKRRAILKNINHHLVRGGHLMLLIPSTESAIYANQRLVEWNRREGLRGKALTSEVEAPRNTIELLEGLFGRDGVPTKHYLKEEAVMMLERSGFKPLSIDKVEYGWDSEFIEPPSWLRDPYPWDWLVVAGKPKRESVRSRIKTPELNK